MEENLHINSLAVHSGTRKDDAFGAINEPIYMTSNYRIPTDGTPVDWSGIHSNIYQRNRNPNQMVLQDRLCALTGAEDGAVFASGVAALAAVFTTRSTPATTPSCPRSAIAPRTCCSGSTCPRSTAWK